ncbi:MAG: PAS domain S-box protein [Arcobacteraceae bacterium]|nr:PAS domain S-box protein [Arcobacteraceae bacterium]
MSSIIYETQTLKYIFDNAKVGIAICNATTHRLEIVNPAFAKIHGYTQHELIGATPGEVFSSECMRRIKEHEKNISKYPTNDYSFETIHIKKNGLTIPVSIHMTIMKDENDAIKQRIINIIDISNKKNIEKKLKLRNLEYLNLAENLPDAIVRYDKRCRRTYVNREWKRINGLSEHEVLQKTPINLSGVIKPISQEFQNKLQKVMSSGKPDEWDFDFQGLDGVFYTYSIRAIPEYDFTGNITGVLTTERNITNRKLEEEEKNDEQLRLFFERQLVGMAITSFDKMWLKVNDKMCDMLGYSFEEFKAMTWVQMTYPEDLQADIDKFNMLVKAEIEDYTIEKRFIHKNGSIIYTKIAVSCVRKDDGSIDYVLALIEDITQRVSAQNKLQTLNATLEQVVYERTIELQQAVDLLHLEISHRKSAQKELIIKEEKFRTLAENSPNIIMRYDENCKRIYANPAFAKQTGIPLDLIINNKPDTQWGGISQYAKYECL